MNCPDELTLLCYADAELEPDAHAAVTQHLEGCPECSHLLDGLVAEDQLLATVMRELPAEVAVPAWQPPGAGAIWLLLAALPALLASVVWAGLATWSPHWVTTVRTGALLDLAFGELFHLYEGGMEMVVHTLCYGFGIGVALLSLLLLVARPPRIGIGALPMAVVALGLLVVGAPARAFEVRHGDSVKLAADETIDGRAAFAGDNVTVDGTVLGDLMAAGRHVIIRGRVAGDLYAAGDEVEILGPIEGNVHAAGNTVRLSTAVQRSAYFLGQKVVVTPEARIEQDLAGAAGEVRIEGVVGRDVDLGAGELRLTGTIGRNLALHGRVGHIEDSARIGGALHAMAPAEDAITVSEQATIGGARNIEVSEETDLESSGSGAGMTAACGVIGLFSCLVFAFLGLWLAPRTFPDLPTDPGQIARRLGVGFLILVSVPVASLFIAMTVIGIPLAMMVFGVYLAACYLATVAVAIGLGRRLLGPTAGVGRFFLATAIGWTILFLLGAIPFLGAGIKFIVLILGLGGLLLKGRELYLERRTA